MSACGKSLGIHKYPMEPTFFFSSADPSDRDLYAFNWSGKLTATDTISESPVVTPSRVNGTELVEAPELIVSEPLVDGKRVVVRIEGGSVGSTYVIACKIETAQGLIIERSAGLMIEDR